MLTVMAELRAVEIRETSIRLGQFLKLAGLVDAGSDAKIVLAEGEVLVNGEQESRRGRQLLPGDTVTVGNEQVEVSTEF